MVIWMIYDEDDYKKNESYYLMHVEHGKKYNINFKVVFSTKYKNITSSLPDAVIMRSRDYRISEYYESLGIPVYNNSYVSRICNDKYLTYKEVSGLNIPCIETKLLEDTLLLNNKDCLNDVFNTCFQFEEYVIKSLDGHGGSEVYLLSDYLKKHNKNGEKKYIIQPFIKNSGKDLRVYVLNGSIIGCVLRTSTDDFKSNYSLGGNIASYTLSTVEEKYVYEVIEHFNKTTENHLVPGLFYVGIDFIIDENGGLLFNEIEDVVGSRMLYNTSDIDIVELYIATVVEKYNKYYK